MLIMLIKLVLFTMLNIICECKTAKAIVTMQLNQQKLKGKAKVDITDMNEDFKSAEACLLDPRHILYTQK